MGFDSNATYNPPSEWLKAEDLNKQEHKLVISEVTMAEVKDRDTARVMKKLELHFRDKELKLLLNKTNAEAISYAYGHDTDGWLNKELILFPTMVPFGDKSVAAIRVRPVLEQAPTEHVHGLGRGPVDDGSEIPFK